MDGTGFSSWVCPRTPVVDLVEGLLTVLVSAIAPFFIRDVPSSL